MDQKGNTICKYARQTLIIRISSLFTHYSLFITHFLVLLAALAACSRTPAPLAKNTGPKELVIPDRGAYTGAYIDFGEHEDDVTLESIENFEKLAGKRQAIIASSSYWGEQNFPKANVELIWR